MATRLPKHLFDALSAARLEAVAERAEQAKTRSDFYAQARERKAEIERSGKTVSLADMRKYALDLAAGRPAKRPKARKLAG